MNPDHPQPATPSPTPAAPPTAPGRLAVPRQEAAWPGVVGTLCTVFGGLAVFGTILVLVYYALIGLGVFEKFFGPLPEDNPASHSMQAISDHTAVLVAAELFKCALAVLLLYAGIGILRRRPAAIRPAKIWSVLKIVATIIGACIGVWIQQETLRATFSGSAAPANAPPATPLFMQSGAIVSGIIGIAWGCALPVFLLVWFSRPRVKAEIARWRSPAN